MNTNDEQFSHVTQHLGKSYVDSRDDKLQMHKLRLALFLYTALIFISYEAVKILYRKNFTITPAGLVRTVMVALCFGGVAAFSFSFVDSSDSFALQSGTSDSHFVMGIIYTILALTIVFKGFINKNRSGYLENGESDILSFLKKDGWNDRKIQSVAEPILTLAIGTAFSFFDLFGGIPIIFCALSVWLKIVVEKMFAKTSLEDNLNSVNSKTSVKSNFHEISN